MKKNYFTKNVREINYALDCFIFADSVLDLFDNTEVTLSEVRVCIKQLYNMLINCDYEIDVAQDYCKRKEEITKLINKRVGRVKEFLDTFDYNIK